MSSAVEQFEGALSLLVAGWVVAVLVMDCSPGKLLPTGGPIGEVGGSAPRRPLSGNPSPSNGRYTLSCERIEPIAYAPLYRLDGATSAAGGPSAGGAGVGRPRPLAAYDAFRRTKFIRIASVWGISGSHEGTPTAPTPARSLISKKKEGGRGCE
jgi:hypothetical protein